MITIPNYQTSLTPFTLLEKTTLPLSAVTYILELNGKELHDETLLFLTGDTSPNINRWNWFPINLTPYNLIGGQYSSSQTSQRYLNSETKQIELIDETIFAEPTQIYQVRFPGKDISVRVKNLKTVNFS